MKIRDLPLLLLTVLISVAYAFGQTNKQNSEPFDSYEHNVSWKTEMVHLDDFGNHLRNFPEKIGYIVFFIGDGDSFQKAQNRADRAKGFLADHKKINSKRIILICGGRLSNLRAALYVQDKDEPILDFKPFSECK